MEPDAEIRGAGGCRTAPRVLAGLLVAGLLAGLGWYLFKSEPTYQGRTVDGWLRRAALDLGDHRAALDALRHLGKPGVPFEIKALTRTDSTLVEGYLGVYFKLPHWLRTPVYEPAPAALVRVVAYQSLCSNPHTREYLPTILALLKDQRPEVRSLVINIISLQAKAEDTNCIPALVEGLSDQADFVRSGAANNLARFGAAAGIAVPILRHRLTDGAAQVRVASAWALSQLQTNSVPLAIPVLEGALADRSSDVRAIAAIRLLGVSPESREAIHVLIALASGLDPGLRSSDSLNRSDAENSRRLAASFLISAGATQTNVVHELVQVAAGDAEVLRETAKLILEGITQHAAEKARRP